MAKYRKKPVVVEAIQWNGENTEEIESFMNSEGCIFNNAPYVPIKLSITTLEGTMDANIGDYIIKGVHGEYYPCKPDIFEKTYEKADENGGNEKVTSSVKQEDVADIMNTINDALDKTEYEAVAYDNTGIWLNVIIDRKLG